MNKNKIHIVILVLFQLLVFVAPHIIKATHHHTFEFISIHHACNGNDISRSADRCPICKYEFVTSEAKDEARYCLFQESDQISNTELVHQISKISFTSCLLRAPPVS